MAQSPTPTALPAEDPPAPARLVRATLLAAVVAALVLVTVVLPAEYGLDPTGIGRATGLYRPAADTSGDAAAEAAVAGTASAPGTGTALVASDTPFRTDEMSITLAPGEGGEIKAQMNAGERLVFSWAATGAGVDVDMHGEATTDSGTDRSYKTGEFETAGHRRLRGADDRNHGWFWQNLTDDPVTVTVKTSGFYRRLFRP
ncbi:MAG: hypothetical protein R2708_24825 [Vicinamibacterales bacterium]